VTLNAAERLGNGLHVEKTWRPMKKIEAVTASDAYYSACTESCTFLLGLPQPELVDDL
jgi:hypothetical protein